MWIQVFVNSGVALGQAASPHAGELSVGEQRGGFRKALFRGLEGEISTLGAKGGLVGKGGDAPL